MWAGMVGMAGVAGVAGMAGVAGRETWDCQYEAASYRHTWFSLQIQGERIASYETEEAYSRDHNESSVSNREPHKSSEQKCGHFQSKMNLTETRLG